MNSNDLYMYLGLMLLLNFCISLILILLSNFVSQKDSYKEKISAYECGFEPFEDARNKFDIRFYIVAILFIIFDIELIYLFPWVLSLKLLTFSAFWGVILFLFILILGFIYEIQMKALDWQ